jgi:prepilin-type processing-associated H-X9-DG protein
MTVDNPQHPPVDQIDAYVAGGLTGDELAAFESHIRDCPACFAAVSRAIAADAQLRNLFTNARPPAGFEDRLIRAVRQQPTRSLRIPTPVRKAAIAAAAVVLVSAVGYYGGQFVTGTGGAIGMANRVQSASNLRQIGQAILPYSSDMNHDQDGQNVLYGDGHVEFQNNPFSGTQRDNIYTANKKGGSSPLDTTDSILLPAAADGPADSKSALTDDHASKHEHVAALPSAGWGLPKQSFTVPSSNARKWDYGGGANSGQDLANNYENPNFSTTAISQGWKLNDKSPADYAVASDLNPPPSNTAAAHPFKPSELGTTATGTAAPTLTLSGSSTYTGGTAINSGQLSLADKPNAKDAEIQSLNKAINEVAVADLGDNDKKSGNATAGDELPPKTPPATTTPPGPNVQSAPPVETRKVIRNGVMEFEVDSFDSALATLTKLSSESGGFVSTTDSTKLPNGKVKGEVILRIPPDRLDLFVLSLRALGDLKNQQITAQDVTKEYTDLESELTAAKAMQARLMDLINSGKGTVKELLGVEQELGVWREKIEKAEGEIRYYNNLVGMSTLTVTLFERDIRTAASAVETETADVGIETEDVEKARTDALKAIDDAKGRVVESKLQRFDAGQLAAHITADVPPESAGTVIDRLKQLGKVARLEVNRQQTAAAGSDPAAAPLKVETKPTRLLVSLYNLANIAPRQSTNITLAANDVETAYAALVTTAKTGSGRVVNSNVNRDDPARANGSVVFEVPPDKLETTLAGIKALGEVLKLAAVENPDTQNTTDAKHGLTVTLVSLASVQPRETVQQAVAATDVPAAYHAILDAAGAAHGRIITAQLNEQDRQNITGQIDVEVLRAHLPAMDKALSTAGDTVARDVSRSADAQNTVDSKLLLRLNVMAADRLPPRETATLEVEVADVDKAVGDAQTVAVAAGGQVAEATVNKDREGRETGKTTVEIPLAKLGEVLSQLKNAGTVRAIESSRDPKAPSGPLAHAQIEITYETAGSLVTANTGLWATVRNGLATSVTGLLWSLQLLVIGLCLIGPWVAVIWVIWKLWKRRKPTGRPA